MSELNGKVITITGASSGIGAALARLLAAGGACVVLGARREKPLRALTAEINGAGGRALFRVTDVSARGDVDALVQAALDAFGRLDVFVNNAGIAPTSLLDDLRVDDWERMIDVNLRGPLYGIAAALPVFRRQQSGHFVNVLSTAGLTMRPTMAVYAGTKQAMRAVVEGLRQEAGPHLRVTNISPGFVKTGLADSMTDATASADTRLRMAQMGIAPEAVARAITFAIEQPDDIDVGDIVVRPTAQA